MVHCRWKLCLKREMLQCPTSPETLSNWLMLQAQSHAITAWQRLCPYYVVQTQQLSFMINSCSAMSSRRSCHTALYTYFMMIHSWLLIGTYHRHVDPVLCLDHPLFPPFCKINERAASLLGCDGEVVFTPQNKQILRFCLTFSSIDHKLHWTVKLKISKKSFKTLLITL